MSNWNKCNVSEIWSTLSTVFACKYSRALISTGSDASFSLPLSLSLFVCFRPVFPVSSLSHKVNIKPCFRHTGIRVWHENIISLADSHPVRRWQMTPRLDYCWDFNTSLIRWCSFSWQIDRATKWSFSLPFGVDVSTLVRNERASFGRITQAAILSLPILNHRLSQARAN